MPSRISLVTVLAALALVAIGAGVAVGAQAGRREPHGGSAVR